MCADSLLYVSRANIFSIYPKILKKILICDELAQNVISDKNEVLLPSDFDWQLRMYFRLLEQQRKLNAEDEGSRSLTLSERPELPDVLRWESKEEEQTVENYSPISVSPSPESKKKMALGNCHEEYRASHSSEHTEVLWNLSDFAKAGKLLKSPSMLVQFYDEFEMRKVYSLIYDVFRYKLVLSKTLEAIDFFTHFPELKTEVTRVWLLLFDLYMRKFAKRKPELLELKDELFKESDMLYIESCLETMNNKLAASITKIRIEKQALDLQSLLPVHLRDEKVARAVMNPIISGWMNRFKKLTKRQVTESFEKMNFKEMVDKKNDGSEMYVVPKRNGKKNNNGNGLDLRSFKWDKLCPHFVYCFPEDKSQFLKHELVQSGDLILQNKAFIVGSGVFSKLLDYFEINGDVLQTHILSPRSTAYLASLLLDNPRVDKFRVFGAGKYFKSYKAYFEKINATNVILYEQNFNDMDTKLGILEKTVAIYAPPPSSFSGSTDPIELICSRGGDLKMLKFLSEPEMNDDGHKRAAKTLEEQRKTLKNAMGRPQIQFILYETHSIVQTENQVMVTKAVDFMNRKSKEKHVQKAIKEKERLEQLAAQQEAFSLSHRERDKDKDKNKDDKDKVPKKSLKINISKLKTAINQSQDSLSSAGTEDKKEEPASIITAIPIDPVTQVVVPPTDLFESVEIPDFCKNRDDCVNKQGEGCYLALLKRKEIVRMDSKYLIKIAEMRGIFGDRDRPKKVKSKAQMRAEKKEEERMAKEALEKQKVEKHNTSSIDKVISRLIQPTQATIIRITRDEIWRRNLHISVLTLSKFFPPRCPRCDFYSQNYYFLPDKFVAVHQFNGTLSLRFDDHVEEKRRASKWWKDTVKYLGHLKMINSLIGGKKEVAFDKIIFSDKTGISPLKLIRFPRGYVAMPSMKCRLPQERRLKYSMSVTLLDISKPGCKRILDAKMRRRSVRAASALKNYNKCYLCLHEYFKLNDLQHLISNSLKKQQ